MFKNILRACLIGVTSLIAGFSTSAHASLLGGDFNFQYYAYGDTYDYSGSPADFTATGTPGAQFYDYFTVTVNANQVIYDYLSDTDWSPSVASLDSGGLYVDNGSVISAVSGVPAFTSVTLDPSSVLTDSSFGAGDISWNSSAIATTWANEHFDAGDSVILDVGVSPVPLPASLPMFGAAILGLAGLGMRKSRRVIAT